MLDVLRRPEYTGENRCLPCTVVNTVIAVVLAAVVSGLVATELAGTTVAFGVAGAVLGGSLVLIYLRGYLVPGTPALTKRYFPPWLLGAFGKDPSPPASGAGPPVEGDDEVGEAGDEPPEVDVERLLVDAGALEPCEDRDDLCLAAGFREAWNAEIESVRDAGVDAEALVGKLGLDASECTIEEHGEARVLGTGGAAAGKWPSEAALVADSAAATVLADRLDGWADLGPRAKGQVLSGMRIFLEDCPTGEGGVSFGERTVESCCSTHQVVAVTCEETGDRLFEQPLAE